MNPSPDGDSGGEPLVSVAIPIYNARPYLREAVESILGQSWQNLEIFLVDDGSTDDSLEAVAELNDPRLHRMRYRENAGKAVALNRVLDEMRGAFLAIQDADDVSHPRRIEKQVERLLAEPDVAAAFCGFELILTGRRVAPRFRSLDRAACRRHVERYSLPGHDPTAVYRSALLGELRFDPAYRFFCEGVDFGLRLGELHPFVVVGECLYAYRVVPESLTHRSDHIERRLSGWRSLMRKSAARRHAPVPVFPALPEGAGATRRFSNAERDNNLAAHFMESVLDLRGVGRRGAALRTGLLCAKLHPLDLHYWKAFLYALLPVAWLHRIRRHALWQDGQPA